jgi:serine/threonine protein kinase
VNTPNSDLGLVLALISSEYYTLGLPPSFETVTRDTYHPGQVFLPNFVLETLSGVASLASHLHLKHISHGDLYAHNIMVHNSSGFSLLGDFGAATRYSNILGRVTADEQMGEVDIYRAIEGIEVRAFGCLIDDMVERMDVGTNSENLSIQLKSLRALCLSPDIVNRPRFIELEEILKRMKDSL